MPVTPEDKAREVIDAHLRAAGWVIQDRAELDLSAGTGVAVREYPMPSGPVDYLLFVDRKAAGVIEAKKAGVTLTGVAEQSDSYMAALPAEIAKRAWGPNLIFDYESTGVETLFRDRRDPDPRSRHVFAFHKPEALLETLKVGSSLRTRLATLGPLDARGLRDCQVEAIDGVEASLKRADPRLLIQMATGAGKTFTACHLVWRLLSLAGAKRILFLVDRKNLGDQAKNEFQRFQPPGTGKLFTELYNVQLLSGAHVDSASAVVISTIQRLYAALRGEEIDEEADELSGFEQSADGRPREVAYNPAIPIEAFDVVIVDECHRSIYGVWRQVLEYFDAFVLGLTATPSLHTMGYFNRNLVSEYPYERSVADGVNVGYEVYRIRTQIGEQGGAIRKGFTTPIRDKRTRRIRYETLEDDFVYAREQLDRSVTAPNQIRTVLEAYRSALPTQLFPGRDEVPKTLIFAKDDAHAEEIVLAAREVFGKGNDFAKKITYRSGAAPKDMINEFRNSYLPRIAVTVDMIATGTDIRPLEVVMFLRDVKSELYYEQMKGRGVRSVSETELRAVTPDARTKDRFIVIDAVGVTESAKTASQPLERKRTLSFESLIEKIAAGDTSPDMLTSAAGRLAVLAAKLPPEDHTRIAEMTGGQGLLAIAGALVRATDADETEKEAASRGATTEKAKAEIGSELRDEAARIFDNPALRRLLKDLKAQTDVVIDMNPDKVLSGGFDLKLAEETTAKFRAFLDANKDELAALQMLYARPYAARRLTYQAIKDLADALRRPPWLLQPPAIWDAYRRLDATRVKDRPANQALTDVIVLVRFATGASDTLEPFAIGVEQRFNLWLGREKRAGRDYSEEQRTWLGLIRDHITANAEATPEDLQDQPAMAALGGRIAANRVFGRERLPGLLDELSEALVA